MPAPRLFRGREWYIATDVPSIKVRVNEVSGTYGYCQSVTSCQIFNGLQGPEVIWICSIKIKQIELDQPIQSPSSDSYAYHPIKLFISTLRDSNLSK